MPSVERDASVDRPAAVRHQHATSSDYGRALIPMWDSSDPERAPPPLPLNPQSPSVASRAGTSAAIQSAHAALTERAIRDTQALIPSLAKRIDMSPEKNMAKGSAHRRMQSLQPGSVRELGLMIEGGREGARSQSPEKKARDPETPHGNKMRSDPFVEERDERALVAASPRLGPSLTPIIRPTARRSHQSILGENTPPQSATMLALQNMTTPTHREQQQMKAEPFKEMGPGHDNTLANITNNSQALVRAPQALDALSTQILSLTSIATSLQKEMGQLSRRSRDNATDLLSLKEATNSRDEDIRKSLRELTSNLAEAKSRRDPYGGTLLLDSKPHEARFSSPPSLSSKLSSERGGMGKINLPRIPSPNSFAASLDRESMSTPSLYGPDAPATIALLEKIVRDMGTRDGQDLLISRLSELSDRLAGMATASKVDELKRAVESSQQQKSVVPAAGGGGRGGNGPPRTRAMSFDDEEDDPTMREVENYNYENRATSGQMTSRVDQILHNEGKRRSSAPAESVVNEEVIKVIKTVKDSVAQGGGLTAEVKALVRELRGEVLGMGREIGRRLDEIAAKSGNRSESATKQEMTKVVEEGLNEMKVHINHLIKEHRRQSAAATAQAAKANAVDYQEIYNAMRAALKDGSAGKQELHREDVIEAVKEAWESYKPEIEVQTIGLERDEILACLQEGLASQAHQEEGVTREEVYEAVVEGLKHFIPPTVETPASLSRDEILEAVRECLEEFEFPNPFPDGGSDGVSKEDVLDAVRIGLHAHELAAGPEKITRDDVLDAVQEGLQTTPPAIVGLITKEDVIDAVQIGLEGLEFPACDARDGLRKEDVVEAIREELGGLQGMMSSALVPAQQGGVSKEDVMDAVHRGLQSFDFPTPEPSRGGDLAREDIIDAVREGLRDLDLPELTSALVPSAGSADNKEVVERLQDILEFMRAEFKAVSDEAKQNVAANGRDTEQVLDATKDGFDRLRADMEVYVDRACGQVGQEEFMVNLVHSLDGFRDEVAELVVKSSDTSREVVRDEIESLREAVNSSLVPAVPLGGGNHKEILEALQDGLSGLRSEINSRPIAGVNEILDALQEGLGDLRLSIDRLKDKPADLTANDEILDALKAGLDSVRSDIDVLREESKNDKALTTFDANAVIPVDMAKQEDIRNLEADMVKQADIRNLEAGMVKHEDIKNLEHLLTELRVKVETMETPQAMAAVATGASKDDFALMEETLRGLQDAVASVSDTVAGMAVSVLGVSDTVTGVSESVLGMSEKVTAMSTPEARAATDPSTREDVQAIETILRNTVARLDDLIDGEQAVRKEHIDVLETLILETRESLSGLSSHLDTVSKKEDVDCVGSLVMQVVAAFDEMKERHEKALEDPEKVTKTDVEAVEAVCLDVKNLVEQVVKADLAALPSKEDITRIEDLLKEFKGKVDEDAEEKSKALELRQVENVGVGERVAEVKTFLEEFQGVVKEKLDQGANGVDSIHGILDTLGETINKNSTIGDDLKDMFLVMKDEFEESKAGVVGAKLDADEKFQQTTDTLLARFDERIRDLVAKYDDFQLVMEDRASKGEARDTEMEAAVVGTKAIADELKMLIDTLGTAVTESMEKMEEASKTVFTRVEDLLAKSDEIHGDVKAEHELTREQVREALTVVEGLKGDVTEYQPQILESIKDVLLMVGQHYEQSKTAAQEMQESITNKIEEAKPEPLMLCDIPKYDDAGVHEKLDRLVSHTEDTAVHEKLDRLVSHTEETAVHEKLDKLVSHTEDATKAFEQFQTLDLVHKQVVQTAAEISAFLAAQTQRIEEEHEDREKTLQETNIAIERRLVEKEQLDAGIAALKEENDRLRQEHQDELAQLKQSRQEELEAHKLQRDEETERFKAQHQEELEMQKQELEAHKQQREEETERFKAQHQEELEMQKQQREEETERLKLEREEETERLRLEREEEATRLKSLRQEELDLLRLEHQEEETRFRASLREEEDRFKTSLREQEEETERLRLEREEEDSRLKNLRQEELDRLRLEHQEEETRFRASLREEEDRFKTSLREQEERSRLSMAEEEVRFKASLAAEAERHRGLLQQTEERMMSGLREEEDRLKTGLATLRAEQESLNKSKMRLSADLSSLQTALRLRREELADMEARAEGLERRILEGVMDHSRVLLMAKANRASALNNNGRGDPMARKRVPSSQKPRDSLEAQSTPTAPIKTEETKPKTAFNISMSGTRTPVNTTPNRRILSLSQINNNAASGPFKRSNSVRQGSAYRKSSWAGGKGYGDLTHDSFDKENQLKESDEEDTPNQTPRHLAPVVDILPPPTGDSELTLAESELGYQGKGDDDGDQSETETLRRSSRGTTVYTATGTEYSYDGTEGECSDDEDSRYARSEWTDSHLGTESVVSSSVDGGEMRGDEIVLHGAA